jgi:hypothetical protein
MKTSMTHNWRKWMLSATGAGLLAVVMTLGTPARTSHAQSGTLLQCEIDLTSAIAQCYQGNPPPKPKQIERCVDAAQHANSLCTQN